MCTEALFYFGKNINHYGYPHTTCLEKVKKNLQENAVPYTTCCVLLAMNSLWIFMITFCMYKPSSDQRKPALDSNPADFDRVVVNTTDVSQVEISNYDSRLR